MTKADRNALIVFPIVVLIGAGVAAAGSQGGAAAFGIPLFWLAVGLAFAINWIAQHYIYLGDGDGGAVEPGAGCPGAAAGGDDYYLVGAAGDVPVQADPEGWQGRAV